LSSSLLMPSQHWKIATVGESHPQDLLSPLEVSESSCLMNLGNASYDSAAIVGCSNRWSVYCRGKTTSDGARSYVET
jgi:hypothetical protein